MAAPTRRVVFGEPTPGKCGTVRAAMVQNALDLRDEGKTLDEALSLAKSWLIFDNDMAYTITERWRQAEEDAARKKKPARAE